MTPSLEHKIKESINVLRSFCPPEGYFLAYSGGKDSIVLLDLAKRSGVKFEAHYHLTTVDPPEVVQFIKKQPEIIIDRPKTTMWKLILKKHTPPTRCMRFCCESLKEFQGLNRVVLTGIRAEESLKRAGRRVVQACDKQNKMYVSPILHWTWADIWDYIHEFNLPIHNLYERGYKRVGCILCPMSDRKTKAMEIRDYPSYVRMYKKTFDKVLEYIKTTDKDTKFKNFKDGEEMFQWWISRDPINRDQMTLDLCYD